MDNITRKRYHYVNVVTSLYIYDDLFLAKIYYQCKLESPMVQKMSREEFVQLLAARAHILKKTLKNNTTSDFVICANIKPNKAPFKLYNFKEENSL